MSLPLFSLPDNEPSKLVGFAGNRIDRQSEKRSDTASHDALMQKDTRLMILESGKLVLDYSNLAIPEALFTLENAQNFQPDFENAILLGVQDGYSVLAVNAQINTENLATPFKAIPYRSIYVDNILPPDMTGAMAEAIALDAWHKNHQFCGRCGHKTSMRAGGFKRVCDSCATEMFPRTDPVAIMLPVRGDKCILARSPHFAPLSYSSLAGFIEPGETIEAAVRRESFEEMGLNIGRVGYYASQPWPFPYSLMIGCHAEVLSDDFTVDYSEMEDGRWFTREEVRLMLAGTHPDGLVTPHKNAIASHLISAWAYDET
ncbi:NAD(+) diphosphatase [Brucellaceae bacterium C25G]